MVMKCGNKVAVLAEIAKVLPYEFNAKRAAIQALEITEGGSIYIFLDYKSYWHSYSVRPNGELSQTRGGITPEDGGIPPVQSGFFQPDAVTRARQVIQTKCTGNGNAISRK